VPKRYEPSRQAVETAWWAAVLVTARAYAVNRRVLGATGGGGRGPITPPDYWRARKVAIYLAVLICDCSFAALARAIGMHRDTVTTQCDEIRELLEGEPLLAKRMDIMERDGRNLALGSLAAFHATVAADMAMMEAWKSDRLPTRKPPPPRQMRGQYRQKKGGVFDDHENFIPGPAE
jgi:hypothetical protein